METKRPAYIVFASSGACFVGFSENGPQGNIIRLDLPLRYQEALEKDKSDGKTKTHFMLNPPLHVVPMNSMQIRWEAIVGPNDMYENEQQRLATMVEDANNRMRMARSGLTQANPGDVDKIVDIMRKRMK